MPTTKMAACFAILFQIYAAVAVGALEASLDTAAYEAELDRLAQGFKALRAGRAPAAERAFAAVASALKGHVASGAPPPPPHASRDGKPYRPRARQSECAFNLANALLAQSKIDRAEVELRFALDPKGGLSPSVRAMSYYFLCDIALRRGRPRDAMRMMRRGLAEDSSEDVRGRFQGLVASARARYAKRAAGGGTHWLYRNSTRGWVVTGDESDIAKDRGGIRSARAAELPTEAGLAWEYYDGAAWQADPKITCTVVKVLSQESLALYAREGKTAKLKALLKRKDLKLEHTYEVSEWMGARVGG